jgi:hypothetical protein
MIAAGRSRKPKIHPGIIQLIYCCWSFEGLALTLEEFGQVIAVGNVSLEFYPDGVQLGFGGWRF